MSETQSEQTSEQTPQEGASEQEQAKTFDADYVDKLRKEAAKYRTEAKSNAEAAKRLAEIEESNKSEAEKAADKIRALEEQLSTTQRDALRLKVAAKHGISDDDADLFLTGSDEETLTRQAERLAAREQTRTATGNRVPTEGTNPQPDTAAATFAARLFAGD